MFKKILQSLSKSQSAKASAAAPPAAATPPAKSNGVLDKIMKGAPPTGSLPGAPVAAPEPTPDELCEIPPKMAKDQIYARLKLLYRRYNHSASSLDAKTRAEAEKMLSAIILVREKHFGQI